MKLKFFISLFLLAPLFVSAQKTNVVHQIKIKKQQYDSLRIIQMEDILVYAKIAGQTELILFNGDEWPDSIEYSCNVLKDKSGTVLLISVYPFSISGDWFVAFTHYFDEQGKTFAFERLTSFYNSGCTDDMVTETIIKYFNSDFNEVKNFYSLTGPNNIPLKKSKCELLYEFEYSVYKNSDEVMKANFISTIK